MIQQMQMALVRIVKVGWDGLSQAWHAERFSQHWLSFLPCTCSCMIGQVFAGYVLHVGPMPASLTVGDTVYCEACARFAWNCICLYFALFCVLSCSSLCWQNLPLRNREHAEQVYCVFSRFHPHFKLLIAVGTSWLHSGRLWAPKQGGTKPHHDTRAQLGLARGWGFFRLAFGACGGQWLWLQVSRGSGRRTGSTWFISHCRKAGASIFILRDGLLRIVYDVWHWMAPNRFKCRYMT